MIHPVIDQRPRWPGMFCLFRCGSRLCKNARWAAPCDEVLGLDCFVAGIFGLAVFGG